MKQKTRILSSAFKSAASWMMKVLVIERSRRRNKTIGLVSMSKPNLRLCYEAYHVAMVYGPYRMKNLRGGKQTVVPKQRQWIRLRSMSFEHGLEYLKEPRQERKIRGMWVESTGTKAKTKLKMFKNGQITCVKCGLEGSHWHIERAVNDLVMPFSINLYAMKGYEEVMLTFDHILPKSMGGSNHLSNAQCMCEPCNHKKANKLTLKELLFIATHRDMINIYKVVPQPLTQNLRKTIDLADEEFQKLRAYEHGQTKHQKITPNATKREGQNQPETACEGA